MKLLVASVVLLCLAPVVRCAETLDAVEELIAKSWKPINSLSYDVEVVMVSEKNGILRTSSSTGKYEQRRKGDKWLVHNEDKAVSTIKPANVETKLTTTTVYDGEFLYALTVTGEGTKSCSKIHVDDEWSKDNDDLRAFKQLRANLDLRLLPEELLDGKAVYVVEAGLRGEKSRPSRHYYSKESGLYLGCKLESNEGKTTIFRKNIKTNPPIADERFKFTTPADVQVQDFDPKKGN